jgi:RHS repeat-associated protein
MAKAHSGRTYEKPRRLATEEDVFGRDLEYTYDAAGRKTGLKLDTVTHTIYAYDNANRLTTLTDEASNNFTFAYDNANKLISRVAPNGVTSSYDYDGMSRLTRLKHYTTGGTLYDDQFSYNTANQISQIAGLAQTRVFTYDNINRLTGVSVGGTPVESYTYDAVGNRTASHLSSSYTMGSFNRLTATNSATYSYNANGSMTGKTEGLVNWTYGWDRENKMVSAGDGTTSVSYQYDALGRRIKRTHGSSVEKYTHDGLDVVLDDVNSTLTKYQNGPGIDNKFKAVTSATPVYFLQDHLGSSVALANSAGSVTDSNGYDSFGNPTNGSFPSRYQFTSREIDALTGLQFSRARFYDQDLGRFVSEDPIGFRGGDMNLYGYVWNSPPNFTDPLGLDGWGNDSADWWDDRIATAKDFWGGGDFPIFWTPGLGTTTFWGGLGGLGDMLRCGSGFGQAYYSNDENGYGRAAFAAMDISRCSALFAALAGPIAKPAAVGREYCPTKNVRIAPFGNRTGHKYGELPHYHRGIPDPRRPGHSLPGQGKKNHRPWEGGW